MKVTPCECTESGWCKRHQCEKPRYYYELCRRRQDYFDQFESGQSILQQLKRSVQPRGTCEFRGEAIDEVECPSCLGTVKIKVFDCSQHERCTVAKPIEGLKCCEQCEEYITST